jgi:preprotein translocase subunit SecG
MATYLFIAQTLVAIVLILVILLQAKGSTFSGTFSSEASVFRTRRGVQKTLFQFTIGLSIVFFLISLISVKITQI